MFRIRKIIVNEILIINVYNIIRIDYLDNIVKFVCCCFQLV
jgi:hypothetical protein